MIHNLIRAAHELIFNRKISNMNSNTVQGAIDELKGTLGYTKKNHFKYITDGFTYNGIVAQRNSDGSMTVTGTATDTVDYQIGETIASDNEQYILSGYTEGVDADCNIYAAYWEDDSTWLSAEAVLDDKGVLVTKAKGNLCKACLHVAKGKTVNIKFYPMVRYASIKDNSFEPYVPSIGEIVYDENLSATSTATYPAIIKTYTGNDLPKGKYLITFRALGLPQGYMMGWIKKNSIEISTGNAFSNISGVSSAVSMSGIFEIEKSTDKIEIIIQSQTALTNRDGQLVKIMRIA